MCGLMINGEAHGPEVTTTCQLHMRSFKDGDEIVIEPWRADAFPVIKDLVVDRGAFDRIIQAGGYISVNTGSAPEAHSVPVPTRRRRPRLRRGHLHRLRRLRRGLPERLGLAVHGRQDHPPRRAARRASPSATRRVVDMVAQHDAEGFGGCTNIGECTAACPKEIPLDVISRLNWDLHQRHAPRSLTTAESALSHPRVGADSPWTG